jgi:hypothetical protein
MKKNIKGAKVERKMSKRHKPLPRLKGPEPFKMAEQTKSLQRPFIKGAFLFQVEIYAKRNGRKF